MAQTLDGSASDRAQAREAARSLTDAERAELSACETAIEDGVRSFVKTGEALITVRDKRLYKETHKTFEDYCRERFRFRRETADRFIRAVEVIHEVDNPNGFVPATEAVARALAPLLKEPEVLRETWDKTVECHGEAPTAEQVREVRRAVTSDSGPALAPRIPEPPPANPDDVRFELIDDAVTLFKLLPAPEQIVFPTEGGDADVIDEDMRWLRDWWPRMERAWKRSGGHKRRSRAVA